MKENTKYNEYRFVGKINVDEIQPWFDFASSKPWDEGEIEWVLDNKVRREILIRLADGPKTFEELYENINFSPQPLLISKNEYECKVKYQWTKETIENHLLNLEWYKLIHQKDEKYELNFPIFRMGELTNMEKFIVKFAENWIKIIKELKKEINNKLGQIEEIAPVYAILVEKAVEKLYSILKNENFFPNEPNVKILWAEQLRSIKFEEWIEKNF